MKNTHALLTRYTPAIAGLSVIALGIASMVIPAANAEEDRDSVAAQIEASQTRIDNLRGQMEGIDAQLAQLFLELEGLNAAIPVAEKELHAAQNRHETAQREHLVTLAQLDSAQGELNRLENTISQAHEDETRARTAIGNLARVLYLEGDPSALSVVLTEESTRDISQRLASVETLTKLQGVALSTALNVQEESKNNILRQSAVKERISVLEETARQAADQAAKAENEAQTKVTELNTLHTKAAAKQKEWAAKKNTAAAQLKKVEAERAAAQKRLEKIDEENRARALSYVGNGKFGFPLRVGLVMTSPFGWRVHPVLGTPRLHNGTDFAADCGTPIYASAPGTVEAVTLEEAGGNVVYVNHGLKDGNSYVTAYVHMQNTNVTPGQRVSTDSILGWVGSTGYATGCHLHFSMVENGVDVDPMPFL